jgi:DNA-binding transcriptional LysR family regulator
MTLKQLQAFYWAATAANFLVAAERLHVSQSSLSKRIVELETQLGKQLFDRSGHRASLTEAGAQLLPMARRLLSMADDIRLQMTDEQGLRGHCRFGVGELAALTWLPDLVAHVGKLYPELVLEPFVDLGTRLEQRVEAGELDFAIVAGYSSRSIIASQGIGKVRFSWAAAPGVAGANARLSARLLEQNALITMPAEAGPTRMLETWLAHNNLESTRRLFCNNLSATVSLIVAGVGIGLCPQAWLNRMAARGTAVELRSDPELPHLEYTLQRRRDDNRPLVAKMQEAVLATVDFHTAGILYGDHASG